MVKTEKKKPLDFGPEAGLAPSREGADNFQRIINNTMVDGLVVIDEKGIVLSINKTCADIFGYSEEEVVGNNVNMLMNRHDKKHHDGYIAKHLKTGKSIIIGLGPREVTGRRKDGSAVALELAVNSHEEKDGETIFVASLRDITERKKAEAENLHLGNILEDSLNEIYILSPKTLKFNYVNKQARKNLGYSMEELKQMTPADIGASRSLKEIKEIFGSLENKQEEKLWFEGRHRRKDGTFYDIELRAWLSEAEESPVYVVIIDDITEKKAATAGIKEAENKLKLVTENMSDIICMFDKSGKMLFISPSVKRQLGWTVDERLGGNCQDILHPDDKAGWLELQKKVFGEGKPLRMNVRYLHQDGSYPWFEAMVEPIRDEKGKITAAVMASRNITEQRKAEDQYKMLADNATDIVILEDINSKIIYASPSLARQLGIDPAQAIGRNSWDMVHAEGRKEIYSDWKKVVLGEKKPCTSRLRFQNIDGQYIWYESLCTPVVDETGKVTAVISTSRNISGQYEAEEKLNLITENMSDIIFLFDTAGKILFVSPSIKNQLGWTIDERLGKTCLDILHPEDKPLWSKWKRGVMEKGNPFTSKVRYRHKDGSYCWFESVTQPIKDEKGRITAAVMASRNITEQQEAEEKLKMLADNASDIIVLHGKKGEITYITPAVKKHLGINPGELVGKQTIGVVHPEDKKDLAKNWNQRVLNEGKSFFRDVRFRNKKGEYLWFECHTQPVKDEEGEVIAAVTSARNITEYKKAESEALRMGRIIEDSLNEIYVFDAKTLKFLSVNRGARENLGYSLKELQGMTPLDIKPEYTRKNFSELVKPLQTGEKNSIQFETRHKRKDGTIYDVEVFLQLSKTGIEPVVVAIIEDITDKKAAAEHLRQAQKMEAVGNLSGGIAHDFNNILTAIQGSLQLLEMVETEISDDARECLGIAIKSTKRGADLTHRLLAFSRKQTLKPKVVEVSDLVRDMIPMLRRTIDESIEIETHLMEQEALVRVDASELENSLLNLTVNARDAMPDGGHLIFEVKEVEVKKTKAREREIDPGRYIVISVSDTGLGMPPEVRDRVFEPFFTTKGVERGTGLGLSMVYGFVKQSGGHITVYSEVGKGTTFKLYLKATGARKTPRPDKKTTLDLKVKATGTILLVEDDEGVRQFITQALKAKGYTVLEVGDGPSALLVMEGDKGDSIDLLLTDVVLPKGMSGPEIGKEFEKRYPGKPIIYSSGYTGKAIERNGVFKEGEELLSKPYDLEDLFGRVHEKLNPGKNKRPPGHP